MIKRLTWFAGGVAAGAAGAGYAKKKVKEKAAQVSPSGAARSAARRARQTASQVIDAVREGREAMTQHEDELKAKRDGRLVTLSEHVAPGDQVFVDGVEVESGRVIVMRPK
jgi:phosphohistidine phosphatase SixA